MKKSLIIVVLSVVFSAVLAMAGSFLENGLEDIFTDIFTEINIKAYYKMDECYWDGTEGEVEDSSVHDYNGIARHGLNTDYGHLCLAGEFDGDNDYIDTGYDFHWSRDDSFTITAWVYIDDVDEYKFIPVFSKMNRKEYSLMIGKRLRFIYRDNDEHDALFIWNDTTRFESKKWYQIAVVYDGETKDPNIYVNGQDDGTHIHKNDKDMDFGHTTETTKIGHGFAWGNEYFDGKIDEVRVYDKALSSSEISAIYDDEKDGKECESTSECLPKPVGNWRMDECSWGGYDKEVEDTALSELDGTAKGGAVTDVGKLCKGGSFDGVDDHVEIGDLNSDLSQGLTLSVWVKFDRDNDGNNERIIDFGNGNESDNIMLYRNGNSNDLAFTIYKESDKCGELIASDGIKPNEFHLYSATIDSNKNMKIYRDEQEIASGTASCMPPNTTRTKSYIGKSNSSADAYFKGSIDEVKLFDRDLNSTQIQKIHDNENSGKNFDGGNRYCKKCNMALKLDYHLDECEEWSGQDDEIKDSGPYHFDGVAKNGAKNSSDGVLCRTSNLNKDRTSPGSGNPYNGEFIDTKQNFKWDRDKNFTMMAWVYPRQQWCPIIAKSNPDYNHRVEKEFKLEVGVSNDVNRFRFEQTLEGNDYIHIATAGQDLNKWYHVALVYDGDTNDVFLYLNGENAGHIYKNDKDKEFKHYDFNVTIGHGYTNHYNDDEKNYCDGLIDEVKIFDDALDHSMIRFIYNREKAGKYWNSDKGCPTCFSGVWDIFRNKEDRKISTKIANQPFNLTLAEISGNYYKDDFNGTVCAIVYDVDNNKTVSSWNATEWRKNDDINETNASFKVDKAVKKASVYLYWKKDVSENNDSCEKFKQHEGNETNDTDIDMFAVRPDRFFIEKANNNPVYAGENFKLSFYAYEFNSSDTTEDYNETREGSFEFNSTVKVGCIGGNFSISDFNFTNGHAENIDANYTEVGDVNITIKEVDECGAKFASIDCNDGDINGTWTKEDNLSIEENLTIIKVHPYKAKIDIELIKPDGKDWVYMANIREQNQKEMNVTAKMDISFLSKDGGKLKDFNETCYLNSDLNLNLSFNKLEGNDNFTFLYGDKNKSNLNGDFDINITLPKDEFKEGEINKTLIFNIDRNLTTPLNPIELNLSHTGVEKIVDVLDYKVSERNITNSNTKFFYGRMQYIDTIKTHDTSYTKKFKFLVYSTNELDDNTKKEYAHWYEKLDHNSSAMGGVKIAEAYKSNIKTKENEINSSVLDVNSSFNQVKIDVKDVNNSIKSIIHLDISPWLWWYGGEDKNYSY